MKRIMAKSGKVNFWGKVEKDFIKELLREKLFEDEPERFGGMYTHLASEESLARSWLSQEEEEALCGGGSGGVG